MIIIIHVLQFFTILYVPCGTSWRFGIKSEKMVIECAEIFPACSDGGKNSRLLSNRRASTKKLKRTATTSVEVDEAAPWCHAHWTFVPPPFSDSRSPNKRNKKEKAKAALQHCGACRANVGQRVRPAVPYKILIEGLERRRGNSIGVTETLWDPVRCEV